MQTQTWGLIIFAPLKYLPLLLLSFILISCTVATELMMKQNK